MKDRNLNLSGTSTRMNLDLHEARWFAVYVKNKAEKLICEKLEKKQIEAYVPLLNYTRKYASKTKQVSLPLINCYVFVKITKAEYISVLQTESVVQFLKIKSEMQAIPEKEIEILKWVVGENLVEKAEPHIFENGTEVEVVAGNLTGLRGKIVKKQNRKYFLVALENIGYTLEVNVSQDMLQTINRLSNRAS